MRLRFANQPFQDGYDLRDFLAEVLANEEVTQLDVAVAWAKRSGLRIALDALTSFRARGGRVRMIVGVDEGGATRQGLEMVMAIADEPYVFRSRSGGTFHPKVYAAYGGKFGAVLSGSQNFTAGGLVENFEAGIVADFDLTTPQGGDFLRSVVRDFIERLVEDRAVCKRLDADLLRSLLSDPTLRIGDEDAPRHSEPADGASTTPSTASIFGRSQHSLRSAPRGATPSIVPPANRTAGRTVAVAPAAGGDTPPAAARIVRRWFKQMSQADAQRPNAGTNPTGHLTLTQKPHPIDHRKYFRHTFFGDLAWLPVDGSGRLEADLRVEVVIDGRPLGHYTLTVDHNPAYEAGQGNRTTTIRWGDRLNELFRVEDHVGKIVTIERFEDGKTLITIAAAKTGPFVG